MDRIDRILQNETFLYHLKANNTAEAERCFCRHGMVHFLDVARIGEIINLEEQIGVSREWIYAAALLHDTGRHVQYQDGTPHELASAAIAPGILQECGFDDSEISLITEAIRSHRAETVKDEKNLRGVLYRADKASRACFACPVREQCNWKEGKKNLQIRY